jgi:hypothetical protein
MKKTTILVLALCITMTFTYAQPAGGMQRATPEERAGRIHQKLDSALKLEAAKLSAIDTALIVLFKDQDAKIMELRSGGQMPDRETIMALRQKNTEAREEILKKLLTEEQYAVWKDKIEPGMRPQRPQGGGGN